MFNMNIRNPNKRLKTHSYQNFSLVHTLDWLQLYKLAAQLDVWKVRWWAHRRTRRATRIRKQAVHVRKSTCPSPKLSHMLSYKNGTEDRKKRSTSSSRSKIAQGLESANYRVMKNHGTGRRVNFLLHESVRFWKGSQSCEPLIQSTGNSLANFICRTWILKWHSRLPRTQLQIVKVNQFQSSQNK